MSLTYIAIIVEVLNFLLPKIGVVVSTDSLTTTIQVLIAVGAGIAALYGRYRAGGITALGFRL